MSRLLGLDVFGVPAPQSGARIKPAGTVKDRTTHLSGMDSYTGPSFTLRRNAGPTVHATGDVRLYGVTGVARGRDR